jgi:hypothetical protein
MTCCIPRSADVASIYGNDHWKGDAIDHEPEVLGWAHSSCDDDRGVSQLKWGRLSASGFKGCYPQQLNPGRLQAALLPGVGPVVPDAITSDVVTGWIPSRTHSSCEREDDRLWQHRLPMGIQTSHWCAGDQGSNLCSPACGMPCPTQAHQRLSQF